MGIERFTSHMYSPGVSPHENGDFVRYYDIVDLEAEAAELREKVAGLTAALDKQAKVNNAEIDRLAKEIVSLKAARPTGHVSIAHDGFAGDIIGYYTTREGKRGVVVQQDGTRVVHVYGEKWLSQHSGASNAE